MKKSVKKKLYHSSTTAIHVGSHPDAETGAVTPPIYQTSTYVQKSPGVHQGYEYTRSHNPTRTRLEQCLAALEKGNHALVTASGMSAVMLVLHAIESGDVVCGDEVYGGTYRLFTTVFNKERKFHFVDSTNLNKLEAMLKKVRPKLLWLESPTNPLLKVTDIVAACALARKYRVKTVVDNTFMSPYFQNPLVLGADIVLHSMTNYINGHSDVIGGCLVLNDPLMYKKLWTLQNSIGPCASPFDSWLVLRGLKTLGARMETHQFNAFEIAHYLQRHPKIEKVLYPGLSTHPGHQLTAKQCSGYGGMLCIYLKGGLRESKKFLSKVKLFSLAESLGGVESLIEHPAIMTHASVPVAIRKKLGISDNLIRLSVGIENFKDLIYDLDDAL